MKTISSEADTNGHKEPPTMESIMNHSHLGAKILNDVFAQGHRTVINLALTSTKMLKLVTENIVGRNHCPSLTLKCQDTIFI
jgi:hypothetical protein